MDPKNPHKQIWLLDDYWDGDPCYLWCEDPAPGLDQDPDDAIGPYIYAGEIRKVIEEMEDFISNANVFSFKDDGAVEQTVKWKAKLENLTRGE